MSSALVPLALVLVPGLALAGLIVWAVTRQSRRVFDGGRDLAYRLGLVLPEPQPAPRWLWPAPKAQGRIADRAAELFPFTTGSGKSRTQWCALTIKPLATGGLTFRLSRQGLGTKLSQLFGAREITVGDAAFDAAWFIQTNQPDYLATALLPEIRERVTGVFGNQRPAQSASFKLEQGVIAYVETGDFRDAKLRERMARAAAVLGDLADLAEVFAQSTEN